jgi:micrococcal nuclease
MSAGCGFGGPLIADSDEDGDEDGTGESGGTTGGTDTDTDTGTDTAVIDTCGPTQAEVEWVIDGDTIVIPGDERVRYILVDTPEITNGKNECYGQEARDYNAMLVEGQTVSLEYDQECRDQYGRLLAYVSVDGVEVNRKLLEDGYACLLHIPPNGDDRYLEYQALEDAAKQADLAMWGACGTVACDQ